ncbi:MULTISPECIES: LysR family transcriptional regulator [unclassified Bradyrhizobium]|uniref:LysR family transcriptional regulator n=1 Tax=unclassified Bradyrhizobium TaxID=2631580 RepID=UPI002306B7AB|nr:MULTISPECIES: LysR family transcriptional regulator [unclassified Bradyrhizobium]MDA9412083.1 hypothetical protein [Bradyrhizobium sp. CCBAU 45384]MDA9439644.1 hypothetical protein [Bradyrhizobium sp. CCBAU 51745]
MDLDLKQLRYLATIAQCGSFSRAAQLLRLSQPTLSNSIAQLERLIGTRVLERGRAGAKLTEAGEILSRRAIQLETIVARTRTEIRTFRASALGPLAVGVTPVAAAELVPRALARLKKEIPAATAIVRETTHSQGLAALRNGELDLLVGPVGVYPTSNDMIEERVAMDPFCVVVRAGHPLSATQRTTLRRLRDAEWVLPSDDSAYHRQLEALFTVAGIDWPLRAIRTNSMTAMKSIVIYGEGVALMPKQLVTLERRAGLLHAIRLDGAGARRALGVIRLSDRELSPLARRFGQLIREVAAK